MSEHPHRHGPAADFSVRTAGVPDAEAIGRVQSAAWTERFAGAVPPRVLAAFAPDALADAWRDSMRAARALQEEGGPAAPTTGGTAPRGQVLVACAGTEVVGFAALGPCTDPDASDADAELLVIAVHPGARRGGHGSRLLNAVADVAREGGYDALACWVVDVPAAAADAGAFLQSAGFARDGAHRDRIVGPSDDDVLRERRWVAALTSA